MISTHLEYFIFILLALWKAKLVSKTREIINILPHNKYFAMKIPMLSSFFYLFFASKCDISSKMHLIIWYL